MRVTKEVLLAVWEYAPETRTHLANLDPQWGLRLGFKLKIAGYDWRDLDEVTNLLVYMTNLGMLRVDLAHGQVWRGRRPETEVPA